MPRRTGSIPWFSYITTAQWKTLAAAQFAWTLDAMDVMLYAFALTTIRDEFHLTSAAAGAMASATLLASSIGGVLFGVLADRMGRARALVYAIPIYSGFTGLTATAAGVAALLVWRTLVGIGMGGVWSAGAVLVAESWPAEHRGKAAGFMQSGWAIGYILAALLAAAVMPHWGWPPLFVAGVAPALLAVWVLSNVRDAERVRGRTGERAAVWLRATLGRIGLATSVTSCVLFAYWGLFTWMPGYLSTPVERGGAGMSVVQSSGWIVPMQTGAFFGYTLFDFLADRFGRRPVFLTFVLSAALLVPIYGQWGRRRTAPMLMGPLIGFFGHGYFSVFGAMLAELFPSAIRATAQGLCYNVGRAAGALAPFTIGALADRFGDVRRIRGRRHCSRTHTQSAGLMRVYGRFSGMRILLVALLATTSAFAQKVFVEFDPAANFAKYHTFAIRDGWLNSRNPQLNSELVKKRIEADIARDLAARGLAAVPGPGPADLEVQYTFGAAREVRPEAYPAGWRGWGTVVVRVPYAEGTLVVDLRDPATHSLVWRSRATVDKSNAQKIEEKIDDMVGKSLKKYPPKVK